MSGGAPMLIALAFLLAGAMAAPPNFVVILADDTGYGDLSVYNQPCRMPYMCPKSVSRNLDAMASEGVRFNQFYSSHSVCSPSRAGLLTGRYPIRTGVFPGVFNPQSTTGMSPDKEITVAKLLKNAGYATGMAGKWHLGHLQDFLPVKHGFDTWTGIPWSHDYCPCPKNITLTDDDHCRDDDPPCGLYRDLEIIQQPAILANITDYYVSFALDFIGNATKEKKPFFFYLPLHQTHHPQFAASQYINASAKAGGRPNAYGDSVIMMDDAVGRVLQYLREKKLQESTYVFMTSDNGASIPHGEFGGSAGELRCGKGTTWEGGQRVAGLVWGGSVKKGHVVDDLAVNIDIFPTVLKLAGVPIPKDRPIDGVDLSPILFEGKAGSRDNVFYYGLTGKIHAVRVGKYKAHFWTSDWGAKGDIEKQLCTLPGYPVGSYEEHPILFDLDQDPGESSPISSSSTLFKTVMAVITQRIAEQNCTSKDDPCAGHCTSVCSGPAAPWPTCDLFRNHSCTFTPWVPKCPEPHHDAPAADWAREDCEVEEDTALLGGAVYEAPAGSPQACHSRCKNSKTCRAAEWRNGHCTLHTYVNPVPSPGS
eukprot:Sspe_Gene.46415::Locus_23186_Transcript_1_1_Confidence_1.000_Length_1818::g.46415::m.46415/K01134/ARSA; arylsulfatase A